MNFTLTGLDGDGNIPSDKTTLEVHDIEIKLGNPWNAADNYDQGKMNLGIIYRLIRLWLVEIYQI